MKTLISKYWLVWMALVSVTLFTACSSDDDAVTPVFPQVQTIAGEAGEVKEFTFEANESWSLSSDKIWCKLVQGEKTDAFVLNGTAGKQTIKFKITADEASNDMSVAQLFLNMGGQKVAIAEVTRSAAGYKLQVFDAAGKDITETGITLGYKDLAGQPVYNKFTVKSNYRFAVTNTPAWVDLEGGFLVGTPNKDAVGGVSFKENQGVSAKYAIKDGNYTITFTSEDGKAAKTVPVIFEGMPENMMEITHPNEKYASEWNVWNVSLDGKVFTQNGSKLNGGETNDFTFHNFVPFTLKTLDDAYQLVVFEKTKNGLFEDQTGAVKLQGEKGNVKLTIEPLNSGNRTFVVYALPQAIYKTLENGLDDMLENNYTDVKIDYNNCFLMEVVQKETSPSADDQSAAPTIKKNNWLDVECTKDVNGMYKEVASSFLNYNGDEIYIASAEVGSSLTVNPNIKDWKPTTMMETGYLYMIGSDGQEIVPEPGMDENENWTFSFRLPDTAPVFMAFQDHGKVVKVLVVEPTYNKSKKHTSIRKIRK